MRRFVYILRRYWRRPLRIKLLLLRVTWLLILCRVALRLFSFRRVFNRLKRMTPRPDPGTPPYAAADIAMAVERVGTHMFADRPCLPSALVTIYLFRRYGFPGTLRMGVAKDGASKLKAHAWIEQDGNVIVGKLRDLADYTPIPSIERLKL